MRWNDLVKLALLGSERSSLTAEMKAALNRYGIDTEKEITEVVLESAALFTPLQKAGYQPKTWERNILTKSPKETLHNCSLQSARHLELILNGRYPYALGEFVEAMAMHEKCLPYETLPELLDRCVKDMFLWEKLSPIIGSRGHWLIPLNPKWQNLAIVASQENWETGTKLERQAILKKLRKENPIEGLQILLSTWAVDGLAEKIAFIKCLLIGLSDIDEVFLEECLDFPRKEIRQEAAFLLCQLRHSRLQKRLLAKGKKAIQIGRVEGKEKLIIKLPSPKDNDLIRNGINPKKKWKRGSETTGMLYQLIAMLPPDRWEKHLKKRPTELLELFKHSEWAMLLVEGVAAATALHNSVDWKEAILRFWLSHYTKARWTQLEVSPIFETLPNEVFNEVLYEKLNAMQGLPDENSPLIQLLQKENGIWEDRLTNVVMKHLKVWINQNTSYSWTGLQYRKLLKRAAYYIRPQMEKQLSQFWFNDNSNWAGWEKDLQLFLTILDFRKRMLLELAN